MALSFKFFMLDFHRYDLSPVVDAALKLPATGRGNGKVYGLCRGLGQSPGRHEALSVQDNSL